MDRTSFMNDLRNKFQNNVPQTTVSQTSIVSDPIWDMINSESVTTRNMKISDQINKLKEKHDVRLNMAKGKVSSGNKNVDKLENARSSLADYARSQYIKEAENDASMDLSILDKMQDQDIIDWMTKDDPEAQQTYIDFINKGWFVKDAYNKMMWIDEEALKQEELKDAGWFQNFWWSFSNEMSKTLWGTLDWAQKWLNKLWVSNSWEEDLNEDLKNWNDMLSSMSTEEYNKYKKWEAEGSKLFNTWIYDINAAYNKDYDSFVNWWYKSKADLYDEYEEAINNKEFVWSVEDYAKYMSNLTNGATSSIREAMINRFGDAYNKEWKWSGWGENIAKTLEFMALPSSKWKFLANTLIWTAEILWLDAISEWKLPNAWEAWVTWLITAWVEWLLRTPWWIKGFRNWIWKATPEVENAIKNTTKKEWRDLGKMIDEWWETATKKKATEYLDTAAKWIQSKLSYTSKQLENQRKNLQWDFKFQNYWDAINNRFKNFEKNWWWGEWYAPKIIVDDAGNMTIKNEEALSNIVDDKWQKLVDLIKAEWDAFKNQWKEDNIRNVENFMKNLSDAIYNASKKWWIKSSDSSVKAILEWTKDAYNLLYKALPKNLSKKFKESREWYSKLKDYEEFFETYIWKIKRWEKGNTALADLEKTQRWQKTMWKWWDFLWEFLTLLKNDNITKENLWEKLTSLLYAFSLKDPKKLKEMIETIYPSVPWLRELWLSFGRKNLKNSYVESQLKDATRWRLDVREGINDFIRPWTRTDIENMLEPDY